MVHGTVYQLSNRPESEPLFFSEFTGPRWLELPITQTHFDSPFEFEPAKFYINVVRSGVYRLDCLIWNRTKAPRQSSPD